MASAPTASFVPSGSGFTKDHIAELFQNCIKLASENKINQTNLWKLKLIDYLSDIIKAETEADVEINFEKASYTLEAGMRIYSLRVDSAHSQAFKLLAQIIRNGEEDQQETVEALDNFKSEGENHPKKDRKQKILPLSTVEQSFEILNRRKLDVTSVVEPDYHQKSIPFDKGGVQGLLLYNLGVYGNCRLLFDTVEDPRICISGSKETPNSETIDLSFAREDIDHMTINVHGKHEITPTLSTIVSQSQIDSLCCSNQFNGSPRSAGISDGAGENNIQQDGNSSSCSRKASCSYGSEQDECLIFEDTTSPSYHEANNSYMQCQPEVNGKYEEFIACLLQGLELPPKQNTGKETDHWNYQNSKGLEEVPATERRSDFGVGRLKKNEFLTNDINFTSFLTKDLSNIFASPRNPRSLLLPVTRDSFSNRLPEDCHYQPEDLLELFLCPKIKFFQKRQANHQERIRLDEEAPVRDIENGYGGMDIHDFVESPFEESPQLVFQPCQVLQSEVHYEKAPKQADMHILKDILWLRIQESRQMPELVSRDQISFKNVLATYPAAKSWDIVSPHLCFICLLHLANEHSLSIKGHANLDDLTIQLPSCEDMP